MEKWSMNMRWILFWEAESKLGDCLRAKLVVGIGLVQVTFQGGKRPG